MEEKMGYEKFFTMAIPKLVAANNARLAEKAVVDGSTAKQYKGVHAVYSGLNQAFTAYYGPEANIRTVTDELAKRKVIVVIPRKGGPMLYLPQDAPNQGRDANDTLKIIFG